jgi:hypothetical protein
MVILMVYGACPGGLITSTPTGSNGFRLFDKMPNIASITKKKRLHGSGSEFIIPGGTNLT